MTSCTRGYTSVCNLGSALQGMPDFKQDFSSTGPAARGFRAGLIIHSAHRLGYPGRNYGDHGSNYEAQESR